MVETSGASTFGLAKAEVAERRRYVGRVRREIEVRGACATLRLAFAHIKQAMRAELNAVGVTIACMRVYLGLLVLILGLVPRRILL